MEADAQAIQLKLFENLQSDFIYLLQELITKLVYKRPDKPLDFLMNEIEEMKTTTGQGGTDDNDSNPL